MKISVCVHDWPMLTVSFLHRSCNVVFCLLAFFFLLHVWIVEREYNVKTEYIQMSTVCVLASSYHIHIENITYYSIFCIVCIKSLIAAGAVFLFFQFFFLWFFFIPSSSAQSSFFFNFESHSTQ